MKSESTLPGVRGRLRSSLAAAIGFARRGSILVFANNILMAAVRLVSSVILTRLLDVKSFGIMGFISTINIIFVQMTDLGFFPYVVRQPVHDEEMLDEVWTIRLLRSIVITVAIVALSPLLAAYVQQPDLVPAIIISSLVILIEGFSSMSFATAAKRGEIARISLLDLIPHITQVVLAILLALYFRSYWALVWAMVLSGLTKSLISYTMFEKSRRNWRISAARVKDVWRYGRYVAGATLLFLAVTQVDKVAFSRYMGLEVFATYILAYNIANVMQLFTGSYGERIIYPEFCRAYNEDPGLLGFVYYRCGRSIRLGYMFLAGGFVACAPFIIHILYDKRYHGAETFLALLAMTSVFRLSIIVASQAILSTHDASRLLYLNIVRAVTFAIALPIGFVFFGAIGMVYGLVAVEFVAQFYCWVALAHLKILNMAKEGLFLMFAIAGYGLGFVVNALGMRLLG
ncbi:oligosaccharide flippase family protein [Sphingomonas sp. GB1N7]|uniref:oligosaccharide flippase family protein n=1 Tax=Parasphingomonas caseinilytica TaxID=3096158 RepID=UPI002FC63F71